MQSNEYKQGGIEPQSAEEIKFIHMTQKPVKSLVCSLAIPSIISMLISAFYNMADTFFVGKIGTSATGAVGVIFPLMALIQAIGFFFGHGSGNFMSRKLGAQQNQEANEIASVGFYTSLVIGIIVMFFGFLFLNPLARVLGATETILPYAKDYLIFILLGIPFMLGSLVLNNQLRFQGSSFYGMIGISIGAIINIALDPLFIFGFGLGVKGASLATMVSQGISFILLYYLAIKKADLGVVLKYFKPCLTYFKEMIRGGFPSLCRQGLASLAVICLNQIAGGYGDAAIAAMSIVSRVGMFAVSALIGFGQGFQPVCGFNYGAKLYDRVREAFWFCVKVATIFLCVISIVGFVIAPDIIKIFRKDDLEVINIGTLALKAQCLSLPFMSFVIISNMFLQTIGKAVKASLLAMSRQFLFFLPVLFILAPSLGLLGIQICQPIADMCAFLFALPLTISVLGEMKKYERHGEKDEEKKF